MNPSNEFEVTPTIFTYGGECLARLPDGRAVFIPYALPEEKILIRVVEDKERYARGEIVEIISPSPDRIIPRCPHFTVCGGCHYQHLPYSKQLQIKRSVLIDQLKRVGKIDHPPVNEMIPSPSNWNYRNHIQFHLSETGQPGFMKHRTNEVVPIHECHLPEEDLNQIWPILDMELIPGLNRVSLRAGEGGQDTLITFESSDPQPIEFSVDLPLSAVHQGPSGEIILAGDDFTVIEVKDTPFVVSAGSFFQVNTRVAELVVDHLLEFLPINDESVLLDVYCGVGLFGVFLSPRVKKIIGIESDPKACEDYLYNLAGFDNVQLYDLPAEDILPNLDLTPNIILLDPPRGGLSKTVLDSVISLNPEVIAYISCDPATLARDARRLELKGFDLRISTPFDMFPQTYHIESVNIFQGSSDEA
jgi:23S rRNA (uracil1939-C5)-methyltransferase